MSTRFLFREIRNAVETSNWKRCVEIIKSNIPADDIVYKQIQTIESYFYIPLAAAEKGYVELIQLLLYNGLNVNERMSLINQTMLHKAVEWGNNNVVELLLSRDADREVRDYKRWTPLHFAAYEGYASTVQILIKKGADINSRDNYSSTPLHWAAANGHISTVQLLIEKGADINPTNYMGNTPLHIATMYGHISVVQCLLDNNCNRQIKNKDGKTALDMARKKGYSDIVRLLDKKQ